MRARRALASGRWDRSPGRGRWQRTTARGLWRRPAVGRAGRPVELEAQSLPAWPFVAAFGSYIIWWFVGIGDMIWPIMAAVMLVLMVRRRGLRFPRGWAIWAFFLLWATISIVECDTAGRALGALYRLAMLFAATVFAFYVYNARSTITLRTVGSAMSLFLLSAVLGGLLAMIAPELQISTPLSHVLPGALTSNSFVHELVYRSTTQWSENSWVQTDPRPSAPFVYANTWGNVFSLVFPIVLVHTVQLWREYSPRRWPVTILAVGSLIPAAATQNRGMLVGLAVIALWVGVQQARTGRTRQVLAGFVVAMTAVLVWVVSPMGRSLFSRVQTSTSTEDRLINYLETVNTLRESPLLGFGAPRPSTALWLPSLGTQGQFWTVLFSHGVVGAILFMATFVAAAVYAWRSTDTYGAVLGGIAVATFVESFYYGMTTGLMVSLVAVALLVRQRETGETTGPLRGQVSTSDRRGRSRWRVSRSHRDS
ncbi:MAG: O-antigen ligase family protein [Propionibacteriaceae bacterium]|nr:O-antigen ligase family protein [Propionibacteriaceae bacterium]